MESLAYAVPVGIGATALTDLWALARRRLTGTALPDFGLLGRWIGHMPRGRFRHDSIAAAPQVRRERQIGWTAHYLIGIVFASTLPGAWGFDWIREPRLGPALIVGVGTVAAPFLLMQPGMGAGIAASRTARPAAARLQSLLMHATFGVGLYAAGWITNLLFIP